MVSMKNWFPAVLSLTALCLKGLRRYELAIQANDTLTNSTEQYSVRLAWKSERIYAMERDQQGILPIEKNASKCSINSLSKTAHCPLKLVRGMSICSSYLASSSLMSLECFSRGGLVLLSSSTSSVCVFQLSEYSHNSKS